MHGNSRIGSHSVLSYIDVQDQVIPDNVVLHGLKQRNGKFIVRIFGVNDNPKDCHRSSYSQAASSCELGRWLE